MFTCIYALTVQCSRQRKKVSPNLLEGGEQADLDVVYIEFRGSTFTCTYALTPQHGRQTKKASPTLLEGEEQADLDMGAR